eukprot:5379667-Amphidinium_carterae.1
MVAELTVHRAERLHGLLSKTHQATLQGLHLHNRVNSALLVEPTHVDPTSVSTTTWITGNINVLSLPKQTSHKRDLSNTFEGNRQTDQQ